MLRFVPYIGAAIAAAFQLALAVAVDPSWSMLLWTLALFLVVEPVVGHVIEPMVYGHSTGLSPVAVVASATFWTALWGPIGLVLATPLMVCLVVLGVMSNAWSSSILCTGTDQPFPRPKCFTNGCLLLIPQRPPKKPKNS